MLSVGAPSAPEPELALNPVRNLLRGISSITGSGIGVAATAAGAVNLDAALATQGVADSFDGTFGSAVTAAGAAIGSPGLVRLGAELQQENVRSEIGAEGTATVDSHRREATPVSAMLGPGKVGIDFAKGAYEDVRAHVLGLKENPDAVLAHLAESGAEAAPSLAVMMAAGESKALGWAIGTFLEFSSELSEAKESGNLDTSDLFLMLTSSAVVGKLDALSAAKVVRGVDGLAEIAPKGFRSAVVEAFKSGGEEFSTE